MRPIVNKVKDGVAVILIPHLERRVYVCADRREAFEYGCCGYRDAGSNVDATTIQNTVDGCFISIWFKGHPEASTVAHECLHAVNVIHDYIGVQPDRNNDEADAYMLGYLVKGVYSALSIIRKQS